MTPAHTISMDALNCDILCHFCSKQTQKSLTAPQALSFKFWACRPFVGDCNYLRRFMFFCYVSISFSLERSLSHYWSPDKNSSQQTEFWRVRKVIFFFTIIIFSSWVFLIYKQDLKLMCWVESYCYPLFLIHLMVSSKLLLILNWLLIKLHHNMYIRKFGVFFPR